MAKRKAKITFSGTDTYSVGLWLLVGVLLVTFSIAYVQNLEGRTILAGYEDPSSTYFVVGACDDNQTVFGWGNRSIGNPDAQAEFGCFDSGGNRIPNISSLETCRIAACR